MIEMRESIKKRQEYHSDEWDYDEEEEEERKVVRSKPQKREQEK